MRRRGTVVCAAHQIYAGPLDEVRVHRRVSEALGLEVLDDVTVRTAQALVQHDDVVEHAHVFVSPGELSPRAGLQIALETRGLRQRQRDAFVRVIRLVALLRGRPPRRPLAREARAFASLLLAPTSAATPTTLIRAFP